MKPSKNITPQTYSDWEADTLGQPHKPVSEQFLGWYRGQVRMTEPQEAE